MKGLLYQGNSDASSEEAGAMPGIPPSRNPPLRNSSDPENRTSHSKHRSFCFVLFCFFQVTITQQNSFKWNSGFYMKTMGRVGRGSSKCLNRYASGLRMKLAFPPLSFQGSLHCAEGARSSPFLGVVWSVLLGPSPLLVTRSFSACLLAVNFHCYLLTVGV